MSPFQPENYNKDFILLRSGLTIYPSQDRAIDQILGKLMEDIPARFILLTDVTGQIISVRGERTSVPDPVALGSLVAGDLAASHEIARMLGQYQSYQMVLREGVQAHTFIAETGPYMVMLIQIAADVPLGWARMLIRQATEKLAAVVEEKPQEFDKESTPSELPASEDDISDLFGQALDNLWSGGNQ